MRAAGSGQRAAGSGRRRLSHPPRLLSLTPSLILLCHSYWHKSIFCARSYYLLEFYYCSYSPRYSPRDAPSEHAFDLPLALRLVVPGAVSQV